MRALAAVLLTVGSAPIGPGVAVAQAAATGFLDRTIDVEGHAYRYQVYVPRDYDAAVRWPVILFLHGAGERGDDGIFQTAVGLGDAIRRSPERYPAIVVMPQAPRDSLWTGQPARAAMAALDRTLAEFSTDPDRVYLTGLSMGGNGTWYLAYRHAERFAAVAPICAWIAPIGGLAEGRETVVPSGDGEPFQALARRLSAVPVWIFHGEVDPVVPVEESRRAAEALRTAGADVRYTELLGVDHFSWEPAYASPEFSTWLFAQRRGGQ